MGAAEAAAEVAAGSNSMMRLRNQLRSGNAQGRTESAVNSPAAALARRQESLDDAASKPEGSSVAVTASVASTARVCGVVVEVSEGTASSSLARLGDVAGGWRRQYLVLTVEPSLSPGGRPTGVLHCIRQRKAAAALPPLAVGARVMASGPLRLRRVACTEGAAQWVQTLPEMLDPPVFHVLAEGTAASRAVAEALMSQIDLV
jgi:hypothetical protein